MYRWLAGLLLATPLTWSAWAADLKITHAWVRATAPGQQVAAAYMNLTAEEDMTLLGGATPASNVVELHYMAMKEGEMIMRQLQKIDLPKGQTVTLGPGGLHVMLIGLRKPLKDGDRVPLQLTVQSRSGQVRQLSVSLPVRRAGSQP